MVVDGDFRLYDTLPYKCYFNFLLRCGRIKDALTLFDDLYAGDHYDPIRYFDRFYRGRSSSSASLICYPSLTRFHQAYIITHILMNTRTHIGSSSLLIKTVSIRVGTREEVVRGVTLAIANSRGIVRVLPEYIFNMLPAYIFMWPGDSRENMRMAHREDTIVFEINREEYDRENFLNRRLTHDLRHILVEDVEENTDSSGGDIDEDVEENTASSEGDIDEAGEENTDSSGGDIDEAGEENTTSPSIMNWDFSW